MKPALGLNLALLAALPAAAQMKTFPLKSLDGLKPHGVIAEPVNYQGRASVRVVEPTPGSEGEEKLVLVSGLDFQDGVIEVDVAGRPRPGAPETSRGFIGLAFRVAAGASKFELIYLRPMNGRAENQVQRNHSVQYVSVPDFPWQRLRKETPEMYESYVDLVAGEWTKVKIEVRGRKARLYVHGAAQPTLLVNDLKLGETRGGVALWIGPWTEGHFASLRISP